MKYLVTYDLKKPTKNYSALYRAISIFPERVKITESCWVILAQNVSVSSLRNYLSEYLDSNDILFVTRINEYAQKNLSLEIIDSLR